MDYNKVNYRILELCNQHNWTKYKLARESKITNSAINAMFRHNHVPTIYNLEKICSAFNISLSQFFDCDLFDSKKDSQLYIELWNKLHPSDQEKVLIYMRGLLHIEITKEDLKDDL